MATFFIYLLKVIVCSALFAGCYWFAMRNRCFHRWNRFYIITSMMLSILIPALSIPVPSSQIVLQSTNNYLSYSAIHPLIAADVPLTSGVSQLPWAWFGLVAYLSVVFLLIVRNFIFINGILRLKRRSERIDVNEMNLYCTDDVAAPFTFFRTVFWKKNDPVDSGEGANMLRHEMAHVRLGHGWDKALMQLACCLFWINPFFILFRRELEIVHEFEADSESMEEGNAEELSSLILNVLYPNYYHDFISRFFQSPIQRRINMITKNKTPKTSMDILRKMSIVPIAMIALCAFSIRPADTPAGISPSTYEPALQDPWTSQNELEELITVVGYAPENGSLQRDVKVIREHERKNDPGTISYSEVEQKPVFQGDNKNYFNFFISNIGYPTAALENGITGMVVASFVIDKDGKVTSLKSPVKIDFLSNELERVIKLLPAWKPGMQGGKAVAVQCYAFAEFCFDSY